MNKKTMAFFSALMVVVIAVMNTVVFSFGVSANVNESTEVTLKAADINTTESADLDRTDVGQTGFTLKTKTTDNESSGRLVFTLHNVDLQKTPYLYLDMESSAAWFNLNIEGFDWCVPINQSPFNNARIFKIDLRDACSEMTYESFTLRFWVINAKASQLVKINKISLDVDKDAWTPGWQLNPSALALPEPDEKDPVVTAGADGKSFSMATKTAEESIAYASFTITDLDIDANPYLYLDIESAAGYYSANIRESDGTFYDFIGVPHHSKQANPTAHIYDLKKMFGTGTKTFSINLFLINCRSTEPLKVNGIYAGAFEAKAQPLPTQTEPSVTKPSVTEPSKTSGATTTKPTAAPVEKKITWVAGQSNLVENPKIALQMKGDAGFTMKRTAASKSNFESAAFDAIDIDLEKYPYLYVDISKTTAYMNVMVQNAKGEVVRVMADIAQTELGNVNADYPPVADRKLMKIDLKKQLGGGTQTFCVMLFIVNENRFNTSENTYNGIYIGKDGATLADLQADKKPTEPGTSDGPHTGNSALPVAVVSVAFLSGAVVLAAKKARRK